MRNLEYKCFVYRNDSDTQIKLILNVRDMLNSMGIDVEIPDIILAKERYLNELASPISDTSDMDCTIDTSGIPSQLYPYELLSTDDPKSDDGNAELFHAIMDDQAVNGIPISDVYDFTRHYLQKIFSHVSYAQRNSAERRKSPYGTMD